MFRNPAGLSPDSISMLDKILEQLRKQDREIADQLLKFIIDGDEEAVLSKLPEAGKNLPLAVMDLFANRTESISWQAFFSDATKTDVELFRRLLRVFEAAARNVTANRFCCLDALGNSRGLEILLQEGIRLTPGRPADRASSTIPFALVEKLLTAEGGTREKYLHGILQYDDKQPWNSSKRREMLLGVLGLGEVFAQQRDLIVPYLLQGHLQSRITALDVLVKATAPLSLFAAELVACGMCSSKQLREAAWPLLSKISAEARPLIENLARQGDRNQREQAIRWLGRSVGEEALPLLRELLETEKSAPVREILRAALGEAKVVQAEPLTLDLPPERLLEMNPPVTPALRAALEAIVAEHARLRAIHNEKFQNKTANQYVYPNRKLEALPANWLNVAVGVLAGKHNPESLVSKQLWEVGIHGNRVAGAHRQLIEHSDFQLLHLVRWLVVIESIHPKHQRPVDYNVIDPVEIFRASHSPPITLAEFATAVRAIGCSSAGLLTILLNPHHSGFDWEAEAVWPFAYQNLAELEALFIPVPTVGYGEKYQREWERSGAFKLLCKFPAIPPAIFGRVWELAIGTNKHERQQAQPVAARIPDLQERLAAALGSTNYQTRQNAAEWSGRLGDKAIVKTLAAAAKKERQEVALDAMLTALERLGESIEPFLDREKLQADAAKNLAKGVSPALQWFPFDALPKVRWQDTDKDVPRETLTWLIAQSFKLKTPEPGALLKRYCELFRKDDRDEFGNFVFQAWMAQDLKRSMSDAEARAKAQKQAPLQWQHYQQAISWHQNNNHPIPAGYPQSVQALEDQLFATYQREVGSAVAEKGVLAVAGACCGDSVVGPVQKYLKEWYGYRVHQCKALIGMLSGIDRPLAIQYILSISNRFRTKSIREEAEKYIQLLADRKGWSLDELADRTMPTCGLDEAGQLELDFGPRKFQLRVNADLELQVYGAEGKPLKKLPDPRKDDDAELAKSAKKTYSAAKTEVKKLFGLTQTRLYEAMCTERTWPLADWEIYLHQHPLVRFLVQRLVWAVLVDGNVIQTFRPLDDGTFTDVEDNPVSPPEGCSIRVAHACNVSPETTQAWAQHLSDYDVTPLFAQFARVPYELPEGKRKETVIKDYEGHLVEAFKLRGLATKFGYTRGASEDGGWFYSYTKSFPGLGIEVQLGFSGNGLPEDNRTVALTTMSFGRKSPGSDGGRASSLRLADVPSVLLAECLGDLKTIAAAGSGFDAEWEKRIGI